LLDSLLQEIYLKPEAPYSELSTIHYQLVDFLEAGNSHIKQPLTS